MTSVLHLQELAVDKSHLDEVVNLAHSLISGGHNGAHIIQEHEDTLNARYVNIIGLLIIELLINKEIYLAVSYLDLVMK